MSTRGNLTNVTILLPKWHVHDEHKRDEVYSGLRSHAITHGGGQMNCPPYTVSKWGTALEEGVRRGEGRRRRNVNL